MPTNGVEPFGKSIMVMIGVLFGGSGLAGGYDLFAGPFGSVYWVPNNEWRTPGIESDSYHAAGNPVSG